MEQEKKQHKWLWLLRSRNKDEMSSLRCTDRGIEQNFTKWMIPNEQREYFFWTQTKRSRSSQTVTWTIKDQKVIVQEPKKEIWPAKEVKKIKDTWKVFANKMIRFKPIENPREVARTYEGYPITKTLFGTMTDINSNWSHEEGAQTGRREMYWRKSLGKEKADECAQRWRWGSILYMTSTQQIVAVSGHRAQFED